MSDATYDWRKPEQPAAPRRRERAPEPQEEPVAYERAELVRALRSPVAAMEIALGSMPRLARTLRVERGVALLVAILALVGVAFSVPFGCVAPASGDTGTWVRVLRATLLYAGSLALCVPSLHVFATFLGMRLRLSQTLALTLVIAAVAGSFSLGFAPIVWFLDITTAATQSRISPASVSSVLLVAGLVFGLVQMVRCVIADRRIADSGPLPILLTAWVALLLFVAERMGVVIGIW